MLQSALRPLTVYAQPAALPLQPAPVTADVAGSSIDLAGLVAGMEPGRLIAVTGTRTDLPAGATVQSGEIAMVASVSTGADGGDTAYSTLNLAATAGLQLSASHGADLRQRRRRPPGRDDQPGAGQRPAGAGTAELHALQRAAAGRPGADRIGRSSRP